MAARAAGVRSVISATDAALHQSPGQGRGQRRILQLQDRQDTDACQGRIGKNLHCAAPLQTPA